MRDSLEVTHTRFDDDDFGVDIKPLAKSKSRSVQAFFKVSMGSALLFLCYVWGLRNIEESIPRKDHTCDREFLRVQVKVIKLPLFNQVI